MDSGLRRIEIRKYDSGCGQGRSCFGFHGGGRGIGLSVSAVNSANGTVTTTFTFNSSNTKIATVSPQGNVCAGVWDSAFVVCNGLDAQGNPISGTAIITATAAGVTSGPVTVAVHPSITSVTIDPVTEPCFSIAQTHQFVAHAFHNNTEITNQIGNFTWSAASPAVASVDANGLATARTPGITARGCQRRLNHISGCFYQELHAGADYPAHQWRSQPASQLKPQP